MPETYTFASPVQLAVSYPEAVVASGSYPLAQPDPSLATLAYLQAEFPERWAKNDAVRSKVSGSLAECFLSLLPAPDKLDGVFWAIENSVLRIWTFIDRPDDVIEEPIYQAQMRFMEFFPGLACDFSVIYRFGKPVVGITPAGARRVVLPRDSNVDQG